MCMCLGLFDTLSSSLRDPTVQDVVFCALIAATDVQRKLPQWACTVDGITESPPCGWKSDSKVFT